MKITEKLLYGLVAALAVFVAKEAIHSSHASTFYEAPVSSESAAIIEQNEQSTEDIVDTDAFNGDYAVMGSSESRVAASIEYVSDIPREAPWPSEKSKNYLSSYSSGTYINELLEARDSMIARWPNRTAIPVRVWIGDGGMLEGWDSRFPALVRSAFEEWSGTGIPVSFTYVADSSDADVRVRFLQHFPQGISGRTVWSRDSTWWLVAGEIDLALSHPTGGTVSADQLKAIALHEAGHLLGLDHVNDPTHIMAPRVKARSLSASDAATIRLLYSIPAGSVR